MNWFAELTYVLCTLTALACAVLLLRAYGRSKMRLLFWSGVCFVALTVENIILLIDMTVIPEIDFSPFRNLIALFGVVALLIGLIWNARSA
ncbi:MAG TPA: DUF5985 family protein [Burkholderiales bacterium]|nr:DUF5985 family protein [Burkholderiales bacterium]